MAHQDKASVKSTTMKPYTNPLPKPPPSKQRPFDPWNSSSTGHQRREAPRLETEGVTETDWRTSRTLKINQQFKTQAHVVRPPRRDAKSAQTSPKKSVVDMLVRPGSMKESQHPSTKATQKEEEDGSKTKDGGGKIFDGLVIYVNGSTFPVVSDHKLKTALAEHGARISLHLARRQVTHVILGRPVGSSSGGGGGGGGGSSRAGCGGGLAGTKLDREIRRIGGNGIKYVGVEWAVESIRAGRRLPETRFSNLKIAAHGQTSVYKLSKKPA